MGSEWKKFNEKFKILSLDLRKFEVEFLDQHGFKKFYDRLNADVQGFKEICITGYFSETPRLEFEKILNYMQTTGSGRVRLMCKELDPKNKRDRKNLQALKKIADAGAEIKVNVLLHARFFVAYTNPTDGLLVIGSFDFNQDCIGAVRHDAGIKTRHPDLVKPAISFFEKIWNDKQSENFLEKYKDF